jgi:hypothetical protein
MLPLDDQPGWNIGALNSISHSPLEILGLDKPYGRLGPLTCKEISIFPLDDQSGWDIGAPKDISHSPLEILRPDNSCEIY